MNKTMNLQNIYFSREKNEEKHKHILFSFVMMQFLDNPVSIIKLFI